MDRKGYLQHFMYYHYKDRLRLLSILYFYLADILCLQYVNLNPSFVNNHQCVANREIMNGGANKLPLGTLQQNKHKDNHQMKENGSQKNFFSTIMYAYALILQPLCLFLKMHSTSCLFYQTDESYHSSILNFLSWGSSLLSNCFKMVIK